jgi:hypothetical protein
MTPARFFVLFLILAQSGAKSPPTSEPPDVTIRGSVPIEEVPRPPEPAARPWWLLFLIPPLVAAVLLGRGILGRKRRGTLLTPEVRALSALEDNSIDRLGERVSEVVRTYVKDRFGIEAPRRTTEELLRATTSEARFPPELSDTLLALLVMCDRFKYAGSRPTPEEALELTGRARTFIATAGETATVPQS